MRDVESDIFDDASERRDQATDLAAFVHAEDGASTVLTILLAVMLPLAACIQRTTYASAADEGDALSEDSDADPVKTPEGGPNSVLTGIAKR